MTREEAIKVAYGIFGTKAQHEALQFLIPELRESEDENLKNKSGYYKAGKFWKASTLWNAVKSKSPQRVPNRYILQECTWNISSLQHFADEVKNVQEVDFNYPIILDMNGNILDGAHRVVKAYLEGKDIDIVYLGDDEWPEPDYDEEKAVKESEDEMIRRELLEYAKGEVRSYDNMVSGDYDSRDKEDKMMHKWWKKIVVYLKKQKALSELGKYIASERTKPGFMFSGNDSVSWEELPLQVRKHDYSYYFIGDLDCYPFVVEEKKEQKQSEEEDETNGWIGVDLERYLSCLQRLGTGNPQQPETINSKWFKEHCCPWTKQKWSEKDYSYYDDICEILINLLHSETADVNKDVIQKDLDWLISLRPQPHWKPSEEQMRAILNAINYTPLGGETGGYLKSLYNDLKKL